MDPVTPLDLVPLPALHMISGGRASDIPTKGRVETVMWKFSVRLGSWFTLQGKPFSCCVFHSFKKAQNMHEHWGGNLFVVRRSPPSFS
jgi:hypothetical protein